MEETNYLLEVEQSIEISKACAHLPNVLFPEYHQELSSERVITMDWMSGKHLSEFAQQNKDQKKSDIIGQALWDFYMYQIHRLRKVHADPHPGNFLVSDNDKLIVLDFGCMKAIPEDFYNPYFELAQRKNIENKSTFKKKLYELEILREDDENEEIEFFTSMFHEMLSLFTKPFQFDTYDFSDPEFFGKIATLANRYSKSSELKNMNANRGSKHFIYMNRTFFGLYNLMHELNAKEIRINNFKNLA